MPVRQDADDMISFLNELVETDRDCVEALVASRVACGEALALHPTVQVGSVDGRLECGMLGVLNGYLGTLESGPRAGWGPITAIFEGRRLSRFERTKEL